MNRFQLSTLAGAITLPTVLGYFGGCSLPFLIALALSGLVAYFLGVMGLADVQ